MHQFLPDLLVNVAKDSFLPAVFIFSVIQGAVRLNVCTEHAM
ncbi:hypothetical protein KCQ_04896 [Pectobacterium atrosepticum ICMP 1526]|nr:hypothetical protein KCQ_04896 [Pectobacterium atrosepticum ICMP 1526]